ncbi:hypothetical protein F441_18663 [Phytophthora nicotianae CJ01A1]|uniref:Uncharacterized protein n=3 Tax=Phytophthora nicotianae TaxID=4792 RepID=V9E6X3_PHYNI|nr:hypothetical protein F443_18811 [Phytophthora nicotianae P1569]ETK75038.1 hypothetical protein L915_18279 [Phytophthora nicotianae]ETL28459.1 hypothetical protein L916_18188 [Phytophthora nicotianae]ETP04592.1 hypothetical protein F441_18663 [Phytophthora nicotianae CJ01A1]
MGIEGEDAAAKELLERARRLCLAARQFELPVILGLRSDVIEREESERATPEDGEGDRTRPNSSKRSQRSSDEKLPPIYIALPTAALTKKHKKSVNQIEDQDTKLLERARRLGEEKSKMERELKKVKQAQERAQARIARMNQIEQQQARQTAEQQQFAAWSAEECAEKIKRAQESRRRAKERIRMKRQEKMPDVTPPNTTPGKLNEAKSFHKMPIKRRQVGGPERNEDIDAKQQLTERKLRQETAARLRRMKQLADSQKRKSSSKVYKGIDRVAKALIKQPSLPDINEPTLLEPQEASEERAPFSTNSGRSSPVQDGLVSTTSSVNQEREPSSNTDELNNAPSPESRPDEIGASSPRITEANTRRTKTRCKLPAWKRPPVPMQPVKCYSYKAILPPYSRASLTAPGHSRAAILLSSETRIGSHKMSR